MPSFLAIILTFQHRVKLAQMTLIDVGSVHTQQKPSPFVAQVH